MSRNSDAISELIKSITKAVDNKLENAAFDKTVKGIITEVLTDNKYKVTINGNDYILKGKLSYRLNDIVYVTIPQNNYNNMYISLNPTADENAEKIGNVIESTASASAVLTATYTQLTTITLAAGTWIIIGHAGFSSNTAGTRAVSISVDSVNYKTVESNANAASGTALSTSGIFTTTSSKTYSLTVFQSSGTNLTANGEIQAIRIR